MTEYWKSVGNSWCDFCRCFVRNDEFNKRQHDASERHQNSLRRKVQTLTRNAEREKKELERTNKALRKAGGRVAQVAATIEKEEIPPPLPIGIKAKVKKVKGPETLDDAEVYENVLAARAGIGEWESDPIQAQSTEVLEAKHEADEPLQATAERKVEGDVLQPAIIHKRRRDGADETLLQYRVETKALPEPVKHEEDEAVVFKKRKSKSNR